MTATTAIVKPTGSVIPTVRPLNFQELVKRNVPRLNLSKVVNEWREDNQSNLLQRAEHLIEAKYTGIPTFAGVLSIWVNDVFYGVASFGVVTDAGVGAIIDAFTNTFEVTGSSNP